MRTRRESNCFKVVAFTCVFFVCVSCSDPDKQSSRHDGKSENQSSEVISLNKTSKIYTDELVINHDLAVSLWYMNQYNAMSVISFDDQGEVRLRSYRYFSKRDDEAEQVLAYQEAAIKEFIKDYQGRDKKEVLGEWLKRQNKAKDVLMNFLRSVQMEPEDKNLRSAHAEKFTEIMNAQKACLDKFEEYRAGFKSGS